MADEVVRQLCDMLPMFRLLAGTHGGVEADRCPH